MKCPKCGTENPDGEIFCQNCDWKLNMAYKGESMAVNSVYLSILAAVLGIVATVCAFIDIGIVAIIAGAVGMFLSGYTQTLVRVSGIQGSVKNKIVALAAVGIILSVVGFIYGLTTLFM